jgi:hypothetical protein
MTIESKIRINPKMGLDAELLRELKASHIRERAVNEKLLTNGGASLRRLAADVQRERAVLQHDARACAEALWQAEVDANISPFLYWTAFIF